MTQQPQGRPEGIYFNLSNEDYHNDPALSHSGMTKLLLSWPDYWVSSCLNPQRKKFNQTPAMLFGERSGMLLLQPHIFHARFNSHGRQTVNEKGTWLSSIEWEALKESAAAVRDVPIGAAHLKDGYAEVSIFWRDPGTGIMLRARIDYLRTFGCIDYKRIAELNNYGIGRAVKAQGLDIQHFHYLEGVKAARLMLKSISDFEVGKLAKHEHIEADWLRSFRDDEDLLFRFLFQRSSPPYIWEFRDLENEVVVDGAHATFVAIKRYKAGLEKFGLDRPPLGQETLKTISPYHVPRRDYDYDQS